MTDGLAVAVMGKSHFDAMCMNKAYPGKDIIWSFYSSFITPWGSGLQEIEIELNSILIFVRSFAFISESF